VQNSIGIHGNHLVRLTFATQGESEWTETSIPFSIVSLVMGERNEKNYVGKAMLASM